VLGGLVAAADALYFDVRDGNVKKLFKLAYTDGAQPQEVVLPVQGSFGFGGGARPARPAARPAELDARAPDLRRGRRRQRGATPACSPPGLTTRRPTSPPPR
jgi:hypothetical protein